MITVFLQLCFKVFKDFLKIFCDRVTKEWNYISHKGKNYEDGDTEKGDFYVKEIVDNLTEERGDEYDPYVIDSGIYRSFRIPILAEAVHMVTYMNGLKSLHRADICAVSRNAGNLTIDASIGAGPLDFGSIVLVKLAHIERLISIKLSLSYCKVQTNFSIDAKTGRNGRLQSLCIEELGDVSFSIVGFGVWLVLPSLFLTLLMKLFKRLVRNIVEFKLERHIGDVLPGFQFPIEGTILSDISISEHVDAVDDIKHQVEDSDLKMNIEKLSSEGPSLIPGVTKSKTFSEVVPESLEELLQTFVSKATPPKHTKLRKPIWCTNLPLFEDEEQDVCNDEYDESDISIQFQFSKDNVIQEDIEPLTRPQRPTCCVFFRPAISESCKSNLAESFKNKKMCKNSRSDVLFEDCSPVKNSTDFLGLLTKDELPVSGGPYLLEKQETSIPSDFETNEGEIDGLIRKFLIAYPKFVAFTRHDEEISEIGESIENCAIDIETKTSKGFRNFNDEIDHDLLEVGLQNSKLVDSEEKYLELCELKTAYVKETIDCNTVYDDKAFNFCESSVTRKMSLFNEDASQKIKHFKHASKKFHSLLENEDQHKSLPDTSLVRNEVENNFDGETTRNFNRIEHVESILKWNDEEMHAVPLENIAATQSHLQESVSSLISDYFDKTLLLKNEVVKTGECSNAVETFKSLREENNNTIESGAKHTITSAIERLNIIGNAVYRCFDDPYNSWTNPSESTFYFPDNESTTFSESVRNVFDQITLLEDLFTQTQQDICDKHSNLFNKFDDFKTSTFNDLTTSMCLLTEEHPIAAFQKPILKLPGEFFFEERNFSNYSQNLFGSHLPDPLNQGNNRTKTPAGQTTIVSKEESKSEISNAETDYVPNYDIIDDDSFLEWVSDVDSDRSINVSSNSDNEEIDVGKSILCQEFKYVINCEESKTDLTFNMKGRERQSSIEIVETPDSEVVLLNSKSSISTTKTVSRDSLDDLNEVKISPKSRNITGDADIQIDLDNTSTIDIDSPIEEYTISSDGETIDCSIESFPECTSELGLEETYSEREGELYKDRVTVTESDMDAQTSKDECSVGLSNNASTVLIEKHLPLSLHGDKQSSCLPQNDEIEAQDINSDLINVQDKTLSFLRTLEISDESLMEDKMQVMGSNELKEGCLNVENKMNTLTDFVNATKTDSLRESNANLVPVNYAISYTPVTEEENPISEVENVLESEIHLMGNLDDLKENELVYINKCNESEGGNAVEASAVIHNIDSPEHLSAETAYNCPKYDKGNPDFEASLSKTIEVLVTDGSRKDIKLDFENAKNKFGQVRPDMINEPLVKQGDGTLIGGENSSTKLIENDGFCSTENLEEMETILKQSMEQKTEQINLEKELANDELLERQAKS